MNKYKVWHDHIIKHAQKCSRNKGDDQYYENHHITPRSLGGESTSHNLVLLTGKEHYIIHLLLTYITTGKDKEKMIRASLLMGKRYNTSRKWSLQRQRLSRLLSKNHRNNSPVIIDGKLYQSKTQASKATNKSIYEISKETETYIKVYGKRFSTITEACTFLSIPEKYIIKILQGTYSGGVIKGVQYHSINQAKEALGIAAHTAAKMLNDPSFKAKKYKKRKCKKTPNCLH